MWRELSGPFTDERVESLNGLLVNAYGELVVWGDKEHEEGDSPTFWSTADTLRWSETRVGAVGEDLSFVDVAEGPEGFVAVGFASDGIAAWSSPDGVSWSRATIDPGVAEMAGLRAVSRGSEGYLAVGGDTDRAAAWFSPTGDSWTKVGAEFPVGDFWDVTSSPAGGFVVVGQDRSQRDWNAMAWVVSSDGGGWSPAQPNDALAGAGEDHIRSIWSFARGYVAFGHEVDPRDRPCHLCHLDPERWRLHTSPDGIEWARRVIDLGRAGEPVLTEYDAIEPWGDGLVAVGGGTDGQLHAWLSSDGIAWKTVGDPVRLGLEGRPSVNDLLVTDDGLVIAGQGRDAYVAIGSAP